MQGKRQYQQYRTFLSLYGEFMGSNGIALRDALLVHTDETGKCYPSHQTLKEMTGLSIPTIIKTEFFLEGLGIISIERRNKGGKQSHLYTLTSLDLLLHQTKTDVKNKHTDVKNLYIAQKKSTPKEQSDVKNEEDRCKDSLHEVGVRGLDLSNTNVLGCTPAPVSPELQPYYSLVRRFCKYETAHLKPQRHAQILEQAQTCLDAEYPLPFLTEYVTWVHEERWPGIRPWPSQFFDFLDAFTEVYETRDAEARAEEEHERKVAERERLEEEKERRDAAEQAEASLQVKARKKQKLLDYQISLMRTFNAPREFYENLSEPYDPERLKAMLLPLARAESQTAGGTAHG
jgi:hypothetical protein